MVTEQERAAISHEAEQAPQGDPPSENVCEHCYQPAPENQRYCSESCRRCELADCDETLECAGLCLPQHSTPGEGEGER